MHEVSFVAEEMVLRNVNDDDDDDDDADDDDDDDAVQPAKSPGAL